MYREGVRTYAVRTEHIEEDVQGLMDWLCAPPLPAVPAEKTGMPTWGLNPGLAEQRLIYYSHIRAPCRSSRLSA